ncbi:ATP-dependent DNA helicase Hel308 [uncultured archaeon]|nr:ATP-dependent DNA helicase Hel308 [uncultured archaeon]
MPDKVLKTIKPRKYQQEIYENCKDKNCLVVLPTGIGKTLVALMLSIYTQKKFPGTKTLFLAPTRPLAEQHLAYFKKHLPELFAELILFTGKIEAEKREELWQNSDIIFSTPQCIANDLKNGLYDLGEVTLLIEDECHRCLKNYSYTYIAEKYKKQGKNPQILGLTASPGTDRKTIEQIAKNLGIESIEIRTRESEDVKEYLQELEFEVIKLDFPIELREITSIIKNLYQKKIEELKNRKLLFEPPTKTNILKLQGRIMGSISSGNKNFNMLMGASACAQAIKLSHLIELLETQTVYSSIAYIKSMFEQANQNKSKAVKNITKNPEFNQAYVKLSELIAKNIEHPKLNEVKNIVKNSICENQKNKTIVFSQYRDTVIKISKTLNEIPGINAKVFVGQAKGKGENNPGLTQKEQQEIMDEFRQGKVNVIVATSIGEEGLDIPEVNSVIFYEPIPSAIRKIQRAGRTARLMKGKLIILMTKETLDEIFYYASRAKEKRMYSSLESIKKDLDSGKSIYEKENQTELKEFKKEVNNTKKQTEFIEKDKTKQKTLL